jgi:hypothetical protein
MAGGALAMMRASGSAAAGRAAKKIETTAKNRRAEKCMGHSEME